MSERETAEQRRARRASTWRGGVAKSFAEMDDTDWRFWQAMTPEARLCAIWSIVEETLAMQGYDGRYTKPRATKDLDLLVAGSSTNLERVARALEQFGAPRDVVGHARTLQDDEVL